VGYIPLHVHTIYTPYHSLISLEELVSRARFLGFPAIGIADHLSTYAHFRFYKLAVEQGIKPVFGVEITHASFIGGRGSYHLTLLAENNEGYNNLVKLVSLHLSRGEGKQVTVEEISMFKKGLIVLSGCRKGEAATAVLGGRVSDARKVLERLIEIFGDRQAFVELMNHGLKEDFAVNDQLALEASRLGMGIVATNNDRFLEREDAGMLEELMRIAPGRVSAGLVGEGIEEYYLKKGNELEKYFYSHEEAVSLSGEIADRCNVEFPAEFRTCFGEEESCADRLRQMCRRRFILMYHNAKERETLEKRMDFELREFKNRKLASFVLSILELFKRVSEENVKVEVSSGYMITSLIHYLLGLVPLNPIEHGLLFELPSGERDDVPPYIELIVPVNGKDTFIKVVEELFGESCVCFHVTQERMSLHTILSRLCDSYELEESKRQVLLSEVTSRAGLKGLSEVLSESDHVSRIYSGDSVVRKILHAAFSLRERVLHFVMNGSKVVVLNERLRNWASIVEGKSSVGFVNIDQESIDILGGWTFTVQQSHFLSAVERTVRLLGDKAVGKGADNVEMPDFSEIGDRETYELISSGDTSGVYFLEGKGIRDLVAGVRPKGFSELMNVIALYKPETLSGRLWKEYMKDEEEGEEEEKEDMDVDSEIMSETRGVLLYDTQVMEILQKYAGISGERAWRMMNKLKSGLDAELPSLRLQFIKSAIERGYDESLAQKVFDFLFSRMKFVQDRASICMQAFLSYRTAYLKAHHLAQYFVSLLNSYSGVKERQEEYLNYLNERGINVMGPDINLSGKEYSVEGDGVRAPLTIVRGVDNAIVDLILEERESGGRFGSFEEFFGRAGWKIKNNDLEVLVEAGVFDSINPDREKLRADIEELYSSFRMRHRLDDSTGKKEGEERQLSLFDEDDSD